LGQEEGRASSFGSTPSLATGKNAHLHVFNNGNTDIKVSQLAAWEMKLVQMNGAKFDQEGAAYMWKVT
jgi:hypothetical protein